ncbi:MAG TPA: phosphoenolpyruvate carboxykinase (GTP) [Candidatus Gallimonas gallistercoris]|uniref:Phosphoenolpyruvate carboxykinase [GTP] n=1 Tax=Candidatus Gallimonas gallistercoris TaxID=2838602 RepID=A0A9D2KEY3_9FIRM|nr:phosphoenolpyruvate carboxykinase (GTP) [Candidatus Gallimonas gallistercoris]
MPVPRPVPPKLQETIYSEVIMTQGYTENQKVLDFVKDSAELAQPDKIVWIDGSEAQIDALREEACSTGEMLRLNQEKLPGCYYHRTAENDVARVEARTFICCRDEKDAGPTNYWMDPKEAYPMLREIARGKMKGRTMYVIPYSMGVVGSPFSRIGIEVTDSIYVVLNMCIMTRVGLNCLEALGKDGDFVKGFHAKCDIDPEKRYIMHFPEDDTIISVNSGYGGNVLLGKKCFALRIASYLGRQEGWMAEHMLILGVTYPDGTKKYVAAAFPSACGKTNLAMLIPPKHYQELGYKVETVGDDIAWIRVGEDGRLWAVNPENGFFGVAPGTNDHSNPNALAATKKGTIFTNVALDPSDNTVWWEGLSKPAPAHLIDWLGHDWTPDSGVKAAHPNSRFTAPAVNCPCISPEFNSKTGVPLDAIIFGGRRATTTPLVYQSRDWDHGVFVGSIMSSETTAAATGAVGVLRHDPMAMKPFCGYHMGDYFAHWIEMGKKVKNPPKIFNVNWFRQDENGEFLWPGFGDNMRVLDWILKRCDNKIEAQETAIGYVPYAKDIDIEGLDYSVETLERILYVDKARWSKEADEIAEFYKQFGDKLPKELSENLATLKKNCEA